MTKDSMKLLTSRAVNKIGNVLYDYGNSVWFASMGAVGQHFLGLYQLTELLVSIVLNPFGGVIADRVKRRQILLVTDAVCAALCFSVAMISDDQLMLYALLLVNVVLAISSAFSSPANKSYLTCVVAKEDLVSYNANLEVVLKLISVSAPLLSFLVLGAGNLQVALLLDGISFLLSFAFVWFIRTEEVTPEKVAFGHRQVVKDMLDGFAFIRRQSTVFFLLIVASLVNAFIAALNYLLPFSDKLFDQSGSYALILSFGAGGAIFGALVAKKVPSTLTALLVSLTLSGVSLMVMGLGLSIPLIWIGYFLFEFFLTIFNIHFFSQVQSRVPNEYLGRVFSSIFTLAILFMPLGTLVMTLAPKSVNRFSFILVGLGIAIFALGSLFYINRANACKSSGNMV